MYGSATLAIEVSSSSMKAAIVTVIAMNHGLICLFDCDMALSLSNRVSSVDSDFCFDRHARAKVVFRILIFLDVYANGKTLHDLHVVPSGVLRREQAEQRTGGSRHLFNDAAVVAIERI